MMTINEMMNLTPLKVHLCKMWNQIKTLKNKNLLFLFNILFFCIICLKGFCKWQTESVF
jgi:Mg2+/citrate symporter